MFNVLLIRLCGAQADLRLRSSHTTESGYIHLQTCGVVRKAKSDMSRSSQGLPMFMEGKSIHSEIVKQTVYYGKSVNEANRSSQDISCFHSPSGAITLN